MIPNVLMWPDELEIILKFIDTLPKDGQMVEWGSGGSTERWLKRMKHNQKLYSIEHHDEWYGKVAHSIESQGLTKHLGGYFFRPIKCKDYDHKNATPAEEHFYGLDEYIIPDPKIFDADIFFIDGVGRVPCAITTLLKSTKKDPIILIHDYAGREHWYAWAIQMFPRSEYIGGSLVRLYK